MKFKLLVIPILFFFLSCGKEGVPNTLFVRLASDQTGVAFSNDLEFNKQFNIYTYRNYYNGGGVSVGDINNDGLPDLYFTANQKTNKLYLNQGGNDETPFRFEDITAKAGVGGTKAWSTGVTMADVNADGWLDIYVCNSGDIKGDNKQNELFINNGDLTFTEAAEAYNLADAGYSTHASFFDYDRDGDLDVYILNNSYQSIGSFNLQRNERPERDPAGGDKLMMNDAGSFTDVSEKAGIYGSIIGFGLGVTVGDLNGDSWDDIYVSNDFFERDYLYINQQNGTFKEDLTEQMQSISAASMGADMADINNDGHNDLMVSEMLPFETSRLKSAMSFDSWSRYQYLVKNGYSHQFMRNMLQLNNGDSTFSEIGRLAGVEASDWSWGALIFDMDNDGQKDIFIANGIYQDLTDQDYLKYVSSAEVIKSMVSEDGVDYESLIRMIPSNKIKNQAYKNEGNLKFEQTPSFGLGTAGFSNGAAYGDLDNDGDLDLVVNNVNMSAFVYQNLANENEGSNYLKLKLRDSGLNPFAIGSKITISAGNDSYYVEVQPTRGFQSSVDLNPVIGLQSDANVNIDIIWPTGARSRLDNIPVNQTISINEETDAIREKPTTDPVIPRLFRKVDGIVDFIHKENDYVDFHTYRLLYHMKSTEGPKMAKEDVNRDGFEDFYIGGSHGFSGALFMGTTDGFRQSTQKSFEKDKSSEDMESLFFDADGDHDPDLYVCSGGIEHSQYSSALQDRLYLNDGVGNFELSGQRLPDDSGYVSSSSVSSADIDGDGDLDLFVGERLKPQQYGISCSGFILENDGAGNFNDITAKAAPDLIDIGMITDGIFADLDADGDEDLIVCGEFMNIEIFENNQGGYRRTETRDLKGWWNVVYPIDLDGDGDLDIIGGNHGLNSRFRASDAQPIVMFLKDFDSNGSLDPILTKNLKNDSFYPYALRHDLMDQLKRLKRKFPDYHSFKNAMIADIFTEEELAGAERYTVNTLETMVLINEGNLAFTPVRLPIEAQLSPVYAIEASDYDHDGDPDILLGGNLYGAKPEAGRYDASYGVYIENMGKMNFSCARGGMGFSIAGEIRDFISIDNYIIASRNSDSITVFSTSNWDRKTEE